MRFQTRTVEEEKVEVARGSAADDVDCDGSHVMLHLTSEYKFPFPFHERLTDALGSSRPFTIHPVHTFLSVVVHSNSLVILYLVVHASAGTLIARFYEFRHILSSD